MTRRIAVTAIDAITSLGDDLATTFDHLAAGRTGFAPVDRFDVSKAVNNLGAFRTDDASPTELVDRVLKLVVETTGPVVVDRAYYSGTPDEAAPTLPSAIQMPDGRNDWHRVYTGACVSSSSALVDAATAIAQGWAQRIVVVAARRIDVGTFQVFSSGGAMTKDDAPRPLTVGRSGVMLGDGAAAFLLEAEEALQDRRPLIRLSGWGRSGDGFHAFQPDPNGRGMLRAIRRALAVAGLQPQQVGHVSVHGTGTPLSDASEVAALTATFGPGSIPPTHAPKSSLGHILEGAGLVEAAIAAQTILTGRLPLSAGIRDRDEPMFATVLTRTTAAEIQHALSTNLAFGGSNTAIILSRWDDAATPTALETYRAAEGQKIAHVGPNPEPPPVVPNFIESSYPPAVYDAARRCLEQADLPAEVRGKTGILLLAPDGDSETKAAVYSRLRDGRRLPPPLFVQSTPASIVGRVAQVWDLRGGINTMSTVATLEDPDVLAMTAEMAAADGSSAVLVIRYLPATADEPGRAEAALHLYQR